MVRIMGTATAFLSITLIVISQTALHNFCRTFFSKSGRMNHNVHVVVMTKDDIRSVSLMEMQVRAHEDFQRFLYRNQHPVNCSAARIMIQPKKSPYDGFALEIQSIGRLLQIAVATERTLVLAKDWWSAYEPENCDFRTADQNFLQHHMSSKAVLYNATSNDTSSYSNNQTSSGKETEIYCPSAIAGERTHVGWSCLWKPFTSCTGQEKGPAIVDALQPSGQGIITGRNKSPHFDVRYYGSKRIVSAPKSLDVDRSGHKFSLDIIPHWERQFGRFWVRAQIAHYLWRPSRKLRQQIVQRIPRGILSSPHQPFIGFHIRFTDNIEDLSSGFGRDANITRSLDRFMAVAQQIRESHPALNLTHIYLATDNWDYIHATDHQPEKWIQKGWRFFVQESVQRTSETSRMWFGCLRGQAGAGIATDVEILRRADFLVGSYQSNVYRLATELNAAWHVRNYSMLERRHFSVDIEWFEDP